MSPPPPPPPPPDAHGAAELPPPRGYKYAMLQIINKELYDDVARGEIERIFTSWFDEHLASKGLHHHPDAPAWALEWHEVTKLEEMLEQSIMDEFSPGSEPALRAGDWRLRAITYVLEAPEGDT